MFKINDNILLEGTKSFSNNVLPEIKNEVQEDKLMKTVQGVERLAFALTNDGFDPETGANIKTIDEFDGIIKKLSDSIGIGSTSVLTQQVITRAVQQLDVPGSIYQYFTTKMAYKTGTQIIIPYVGEGTGARDIGPGQELPMLSFDRDAEIISNTGRSGIGISLPEETMRLANYPILNLYMQKAKEALAKWKDHKAIMQVLSTGTVIFDNVDPESAVLGHTTGRNIADGKLNGTFTLKDLFNMYMHGIKLGYKMDTILMSQWGYLIFMYEPTLRKFIEANNGVLFTTVNGKIGQNSRNYIAKQSRSNGPADAYQSIEPSLPKELINVNFNIIVTNYIPSYKEGDKLVKSFAYTLGKDKKAYKYKAEFGTGTDAQKSVGNVNWGAKTANVTEALCGKNPMTDLVMLDSTNCLLYLEEEPVRVDKRVDNMKECTEIYLRERYTYSTLEKGRATLVAKNLVITEDTFDYLYKATSSIGDVQKAIAAGVDRA